MITIKEVLIKFNIPRSTIERWHKLGLIHRTGSLYFEEEIEKLFQEKRTCVFCGILLNYIPRHNKNGPICKTCKSKCRNCNIVLTKENSYKNVRVCYKCKKEYEKINSAMRRKTSPDKIKFTIAKCKHEIKSLVFNHYSNKNIACIKCGFKDIRALSIDHINGGGTKHRKEIGNIYYWLKNNNFPEGYQVLCMNCQFIKRHENNEQN